MGGLSGGPRGTFLPDSAPGRCREHLGGVGGRVRMFKHAISRAGAIVGGSARACRGGPKDPGLPGSGPHRFDSRSAKVAFVPLPPDTWGMFTGIVQAVGKVESVRKGPGIVRLTIDRGGWSFTPGAGDSISVDGVCLTLVEAAGGLWGFDVIPETLSKTTLGALNGGSPVNLEHAATAATFLGGHVVQGHVDGLGEIVEVREGSDWRIRVRPPAPLMEYMVPKGSVCLSGVSLTLAEVRPSEGWFEVALIPATLEKTNLGTLAAGQMVNVEADCLSKTIIHWLKNYSGQRRL